MDAFFATWVKDLVQRAVESLAAEYYRQSKGDYVRVLYGRLCRGLSFVEVAGFLEIEPSAADNYFRHIRQRLSEKLKELLEQHVRRYCKLKDVAQELALEWEHLGSHLAEFGGLEAAVRRVYDLLDPVQGKKSTDSALAKAATRLSLIIQASSDATDSDKTT